jgi:hypothetical protein
MKQRMVYGIKLRGDVGIESMRACINGKPVKLRTFYRKRLGSCLYKAVWGVKLTADQIAKPEKCLSEVARFLNSIAAKNSELIRGKRARVLRVLYPDIDESEWWEDEAAKIVVTPWGRLMEPDLKKQPVF